MYTRFFPQTVNQKRVVLDETISNITNGHIGGCYSPYNNKVYFAPYQTDYIIEFDFEMKISTKIYFDTNIVGSIAQTIIPQYCQGAVYAPNNKIYFVPYCATHLIIYDLISETFEYVPGFSGINEGKYNGGVIANDGFLYLIPYNSSSVCKIDLSDNSISFFGSTGLTHLGGCLAINNNIYQAPIAGVSFRRINLTTNTVGTFGNLGSGSFRWINGCNGLDGRIFFPPLLGNTILILDPSTETWQQISISGLSGSSYFGNLQLAPNGNLYGFSYSSTRFVEVIPSVNLARSFYVNGSNIYHGNVYCEKGIIGVPRQTNLIKRLENIGKHSSEMITFPLDVSTISTSIWNKFQQTL